MEKKSLLVYLLRKLLQNALRKAVMKMCNTQVAPFGIKALYRVSSLVSDLEISEIGPFILFCSKVS